MTDAPRFHDRFGAADGYAEYRPRYPGSLFDAVAGLAPGRSLAWDCATGSGQAALELARRFDRVVASDASAGQLARAASHPGVSYRLALAHASGLPDGSVDLVTVAQALHWLPLEAFYREVRRVLRPRGALAVWTYGRPVVSPGIDRIMTGFYDQTIGPWWPAERRMVDAGYAGLSFPFPEEALAPQEMRQTWTLRQFLGYVGTWSAVIRYRADRRLDPVAALEEALLPEWGDSATPRPITWPLVVRAGRGP